MKIEDILNHKKILIWGYGREGRSMKSFIDRHVSAAECAVFEGRQENRRKSPAVVPVDGRAAEMVPSLPVDRSGPCRVEHARVATSVARL